MNGFALRQPQSDRLTVVEWILTRTSSSFGTGRSTSSSRRTSGGPYLSWTTALIEVPAGERFPPSHRTLASDKSGDRQRGGAAGAPVAWSCAAKRVLSIFPW